MKPNEVRELIELVSRSNFTSFELERNDFKLRMVKEAGSDVAPRVVQTVVAPSLESRAEGGSGTAAAAPAEPSAEPTVADGLYEMHSPIVGTFYRSPSPEAKPFVEIGSRVSTGQVLCIVEAMKVMNEIESEIDAEVVEVLIASGQPVEYGEIMFRLRPLN